MSDTPTVWTTVYTDRDGNELLLLNSRYFGQTEQEAKEIKTGTMLVECIILGLTANDVREFDLTDLPHIEAYLPNRGGHFPVKVAVIGGPAFEEAATTPVPEDADRAE